MNECETIGFNSIKVRLIPAKFARHNGHLESFNSIKVRLILLASLPCRI